MARKVVIEAVLVEESQGMQPKDIEREILKEIHHGYLVIPWCDKVEKVRVIEEP